MDLSLVLEERMFNVPSLCFKFVLFLKFICRHVFYLFSNYLYMSMTLTELSSISHTTSDIFSDHSVEAYWRELCFWDSTPSLYEHCKVKWISSYLLLWYQLLPKIKVSLAHLCLGPHNCLEFSSFGLTWLTCDLWQIYKNYKLLDYLDFSHC